MDIAKILQSEFNIEAWQVKNTLELIDEGNTIPFIARYRKEKTGSLSDEVLRDFDERLKYLTNLENRKEQIIENIDGQGKLTEALKKSISGARTLVELEDLYRPYKQKRKTRATVAKDNGLEPLSMLIYMQQKEKDVDTAASEFLSENVTTIEEAIGGAKDIIAEMISDEADYRSYLRNLLHQSGQITTKAKSKESTVYDMYAEYAENVKSIPGHRVLAINRGEKEKVLSVKIECDENRMLGYLKDQIIRNPSASGMTYLLESIEDSFKRLIFPSIEREVRNSLTEDAEEAAIKVFGKNLEQLLMQPPVLGNTVLALDPAFRTGCKTAVIDSLGKVLATAVIYPTAPHNKIAEAEKVIYTLIKEHNVSIIAIGNGTASRETEMFAADLLKKIPEKVMYTIVNEAGASVYSASKLGSEEFPEYDVALRSAVSIGRRLQDPLAELVKIDPKAIGVGQYQHDMNQKKLADTLAGVVEDSVNKVGIDLNMASAPLLSYISGVSSTIAKNIVSYREANGRFNNRKELLKVTKLGPKAYEQCAGFLRIRDGEDLLDNTGVHPESYKATKQLIKAILNKDSTDLKQVAYTVRSKGLVKKYAEELDIGEPTLLDILKELEKPGRDPREEMQKPILRSDVLEMKDLKEGMILKGTIRNVIDFGAFVDIGVHQDGLVHISKLSDKYIKHPLEVVAIGDVVEVQVISIDINKKRIGLSMVF